MPSRSHSWRAGFAYRQVMKPITCSDSARFSNWPPASSLAARFAAKEAVAKALGTGFAQGIMPEQIEVTHADSGQPGARLTGAAQARLEQMGGGRILLSLSHEGDTAIAFALIQ